jgi:hypothetical protein
MSRRLASNAHKHGGRRRWRGREKRKRAEFAASAGKSIASA